jgi:phosphatidylserine decarboxylase
VGSIETVWHGQVTPPYRFRSHRWAYASGTGAVLLERGQEMGRFNLGSTVIVLFGADALQLDAAISAGSPVEMGQLLGSLGT